MSSLEDQSLPLRPHRQLPPEITEALNRLMPRQLEGPGGWVAGGGCVPAGPQGEAPPWIRPTPPAGGAIPPGWSQCAPAGGVPSPAGEYWPAHMAGPDVDLTKSYQADPHEILGAIVDLAKTGPMPSGGVGLVPGGAAHGLPGTAVNLVWDAWLPADYSAGLGPPWPGLHALALRWPFPSPTREFFETAEHFWEEFLAKARNWFGVAKRNTKIMRHFANEYREAGMEQSALDSVPGWAATIAKALLSGAKVFREAIGSIFGPGFEKALFTILQGDLVVGEFNDAYRQYKAESLQVAKNYFEKVRYWPPWQAADMAARYLGMMDRAWILAGQEALERNLRKELDLPPR